MVKIIQYPRRSLRGLIECLAVIKLQRMREELERISTGVLAGTCVMYHTTLTSNVGIMQRRQHGSSALALARGTDFMERQIFYYQKDVTVAIFFFFFFWLLLFEISGGKSAEAKGWLFIFVASVSSFNTEIRMTMNAAVRHERCFELKKITQIYVAYVLAV